MVDADALVRPPEVYLFDTDAHDAIRWDVEVLEAVNYAWVVGVGAGGRADDGRLHFGRSYRHSDPVVVCTHSTAAIVQPVDFHFLGIFDLGDNCQEDEQQRQKFLHGFCLGKMFNDYKFYFGGVGSKRQFTLGTE